ncbi:MAG: molecular chaperone DnaJ [Gammaproteobacteria bacterium]|jgi:hypothetical protein
MVTESSQLLRISPDKKADSLTPAQKKFNSLTKRIDRQRRRLAEWQEIMPSYQEEVVRTYQPLRDSYVGFQAEMVSLLDDHYLKNRFSRVQKNKLSHIISNICEELIRDHGRDDLKTIHNRHSDIDFDHRQELVKGMGEDALREMLEAGFDLDLDDVELDIDDPHGTAEKLGAILEEQQRQAQEKRSRRKKTARQLAKEQREKEEERRVSQSIQAVYRQLVRALHPDREQDPEERKRKTDLMQKVTVAYKESDLLQLLELQLVVEQIDQNAIDSIGEDRLKYFNRILQRQSQELKQEIEEVELHLKAAGGFAPFESLTPRKLISALRNDRRELELAVIQIQKDIERFRDVRKVKSWLKDYELPPDRPDDLLLGLFG